jgi:hypothetical protein
MGDQNRLGSDDLWLPLEAVAKNSSRRKIHNRRFTLQPCFDKVNFVEAYIPVGGTPRAFVAYAKYCIHPFVCPKELLAYQLLPNPHLLEFTTCLPLIYHGPKIVLRELVIEKINKN